MNGIEIHAEVCNKLAYAHDSENKYRSLLSEFIGIDSNTIISTSEHIAPFNTPSTISFIYPQLLLQEFGLLRKKKIVVLAGSLIPIDNADYPRGFFIPNNSRLEKLNLFSQKQLKKSPLLLNMVDTYLDNLIFSNNYPFIEESFLLKHQSYAHQMSYIMEQISKRWFASKPTVNVYPLEDIAAKILTKLIEDDDIIICSLLFNKNIRGIIINELFNVFCAWGENKGSVLFWIAKENGKIAPFDLSFDGELIERGGGASITLEKDCILENLINRKIFPSVYLSLLVVSYLPSYPIAGGRKQLYYYRHMISATNKALNINRSIDLSVHGYDRTVYVDNKYITKYGTGLNLINNKPDLDYHCQALKQCLINEPLDVYYD